MCTEHVGRLWNTPEDMSTEGNASDAPRLSVHDVLLARAAYGRTLGPRGYIRDWIECGRGTFAVVYLHPRDPSLVVKVFNVPRVLSVEKTDTTDVPESTVARYRSEVDLLLRLGKADTRACFPQLPADQPPPLSLMFVMERGLCGMEDLPKYALYGDAAPRPTKGFVFPQFTLDDTEYILYRMLECVHVAHENGVSHLDIKPSNFIVRLYRRSRMRELMRVSGASRQEAVMMARVNPGSYAFPCVDGTLHTNRDAEDICMDIFLCDWGESRSLHTATGQPMELLRGATYTTFPYRAPELMTLAAVPLTRSVDAWGLGCCAVDILYQLMRAPVFDIDCEDADTVSPEELTELSNRMLCHIASVTGNPRGADEQRALRIARAAVHAEAADMLAVCAMTATDEAIERGALLLDLDCVRGRLLQRVRDELAVLRLKSAQLPPDSEARKGAHTAIEVIEEHLRAPDVVRGHATPVCTKRLVLALLEWNPVDRVRLSEALTNQLFWSRPLDRIRGHCVPRVSFYRDALIAPCLRANDAKTKTIGDGFFCAQSIIRYIRGDGERESTNARGLYLESDEVERRGGRQSA